MAIKQRPDSPTNNFATLNPLGFKNFGGANSAQILSEGNLKSVASGTEGSGELSSILPSKTGINKVYFEARGLGSASSTDRYIAIFEDNGVNLNPTNVHRNVGQNEIVSWVIDVSAGKLWRQSNGNWSAARKIEIENGQNPDLTFNCTTNILEIWFATYNTSSEIVVNFGQDQTFAGTASGGAGATDSEGYGQFYYQPPTGALALCTANLPDFTPTVTGDTPQDYFKAVTYTGNGTGQSITGVGFQPDLVWIKNRDQADGHRLFTSSTGVHNYFQTDSASTGTSTTSLTSFNSTGFSIGTDVTVNTSGEKYVGWCWAAGSSETNNDGTIQSTIRRNVNSGISIVQYTGNGNASSTVGHGLSTVDCILGIQNISGHIHFPNILGLSYMQISSVSNATSDAGSSGTFGNFTSSTFGFRSGLSNIDGVNTNGSAYTVLVFQNVEGFSKIGSYTGNGSADGPFLYCGFRPAFVMIKASSFDSSWYVNDSARSPSNPSIRPLSPDLTKTETDTTGGYLPDEYYIDILSNGFKIRNTYSPYNVSNETYIYMAFAEQPFIYSNAR